MAFTQQDKANIRHFLGYGAIFKQADLRLENAMQAVESVSDGGSQPDSTSENAVRSIVADLLTVECVLKNLWVQMQAGQVGKNKIDALRGAAGVRAEGRRLVTGLSVVLSTSPRRDIFGPTAPNPDGDAFYDAPGGAGFQW
jgi:hypothetical protein